jgi:dTMP kinase
MRFRPGALVVLEGMDATGKTTQRDMLRSLPWSAGPRIVHMPSGLTDGSAKAYELLERRMLMSPLAVQLLHLACHAENMPALRAAREVQGLVLDRWWWSTIAYGWFGGLDRTLRHEAFFGAVEMVWTGMRADVVLLFEEPFRDDTNNSAAIADGYRWLAEQDSHVVVQVPRADAAATSRFIMNALTDRDIVS